MIAYSGFCCAPSTNEVQSLSLFILLFAVVNTYRGFTLRKGRLWVSVWFTSCRRHEGEMSPNIISKDITLYALSVFLLVGFLPRHVSCLEFHVAPMQGYTNFALRQLLQELSRASPSIVLWTEMEKIPDLLEADAAALQRRFGVPDGGTKPVVLQVGGNDPVTMGHCMRHLTAHGYSFAQVNLNCGCPSIAAGGAATFGASLMKQPELTRDLISVLRDHCPTETTHISLKCRIAVLETADDVGLPFTEEQYDRLVTYARCAQEGACLTWCCMRGPLS